MATTEEYKDGGSASYTFSIEYIKAEDIKVAIDGGTPLTYTATNPPAQTTEYTVNGSNVIFKQASVSGSTNGGVRIYRETNLENSDSVTFQPGSSIKAAELNANHRLVRFSAQEKNQEITTADIRDSAVTTAKIKDQSVNTSKLANDAVTAAKIGDDQINSEHYVDGSINTAHIADAQITTAKIADDAVTNAKISPSAVSTTELTNSSVTTDKLATDAVTTVKIQATAVTTAKLANDAVTSTKLADSNVTTAKIADDAVTDAKIADGTLDGRYYTETELDAGQLDNRYFTETELTNGALDGRYFTETELTNGALDGRYFTETEADARYFNITTGDTVKDGDTFPDNDTTIATTAAINDRIIDLIDDVGGFVPIDNETSFPTSNPDANGEAGTIVSVKAASTNLAPSGTTVTIANGRGTGNAVIITGVSATIPSGFGFLVETTTTDHTYTFHRLVPKATEITTVAGSVGSVNTVAGAISNVNSVAGNASNINTVAGINTNVTTVAGISSNVTSVANNEININAVQGNATNINAVAGNNSNITAVAGNSSNINSAVSNASNINSAVSNASNINTVAGSISNVNTTATNIASINTTASNITNVNNFADVYQIASSNPSTDGGGNAVAEGDLYFNTTANRLKVYDGTNWVDGVAASSGGGVQTTGATFTGDVKLNDDVNLVLGTGDDLKILHDGSNSYIKDSGTGALILNTDAFQIKDQNNSTFALTAVPTSFVKLFFNNSVKLETQSGGVGITGDITLSGNVDGRDVAADGTKLDNIEANATADQTAAEIRTLVENASDSNVFTDADHSKLDGIEASATADQTAAEIRTLVESASDSNVFTDADHTKLNAIEASATADQTASEIVALVADQTIAPSTIDMEDSEKILLGTGDDLQIYHDGTNSIIDNNTGVLSIQGDDVRIQNSAGGETGLRFIADGATELYHDNVKRLQTQSGGIEITSGENETAGIYLTADEGDDNNDYWRVNAGTSGDLAIQNYASGSWETSIECNGNGNVELYYDNSKKFETNSSGVNIASGNLQIDGTNVINSGKVLYNLDQIKLADNKKAIFGSGDDLQIYHNGSHSFVDGTTTGDLYLRATADDLIAVAADDLLLMTATSDTAIRCNANAAVELYYDNSKKFETTSNGVSLPSDIRFVNSGSWSGESCKIQHYGDSLYIQGGTSTDYNIILRAGPGVQTDRLYMASGGDFYPATNNSQSLGRASHQWGTIFGVNLDLGNPTIAAGDTNGVRITNPNGYVQLGPLNSSYAHFYTDRPQYYFDSPIEVNGHLKPYSTNTKTLGDFNHRWSSIHGTNIEVYGSIQNVGLGKGVAILRERLSHDAETGSFSSGADRIRELNVHETSGTGLESFVTLNTTSHYFTLQAGTYFVEFTAGAFDTNNHRAKLITYDGADRIFGNNARSGSGDSTSTYSIGSGYIAPTSQQSYYLVHRAGTTRSTKGFGLACDFASENEYYSQVIIYRIS